jgi:hypothetical protein
MKIRLVVLLMVAWATGAAVYLLVLKVINGEPVSDDELRALLFWSAVSFVFASFVFYLPVLFLLRSVLGGTRPGWLFAAVAVVTGMVPFLLLNATWGDKNWHTFLSVEAALFYSMFAAVGVVVGFGFSRLYR